MKRFNKATLLAILVTLIGVVAIPAVAEASVGLGASSGNRTGDLASPVNFGATVQSALPKQVTIYLYNDHNSILGGESSSNVFNITGTGYRRNGGTCNGTATGTSWTSTISGSSGFTGSGNSCSIILELQAGTAVGTRTGNISFTSNRGIENGTGSRALTGDVTAENGSVSRTYLPNGDEGASFSYGEVANGDSSARTFTYRNTGTNPVTGFTQTLGAPQPSSYSITANTCSTTLAVNAQCTVTVTYQPTAAVGPEPKSLNFGSTSHGTKTIALTGEGLVPVANFTVTPTSHNYGDAAVGFGTGRLFTIQNTGNTTLSLSTSLASGEPAFSAAAGGTCGATLAVGLSCTQRVNFDPTPGGPDHQTATFRFTGSTPLVATAENRDVSLEGTRVPPVRSYVVQNTAGTQTVTSQELASAEVGTNGDYTFTIRNTGNTTVTGLTPTLSGANASLFSIASNGCATLLRDTTCQITVRANSPRTGTKRATLTLTPAAATPPAPVRTIPLTFNATGFRILNDVGDNLTNVTQKRWLDTLAAGGAANIGDRLRAAFEVDQGVAQTIEDVLIANTATTNDTPPAASAFNPIPGGIGKVEVQRQPGSGQAFVIAEMPATSAIGSGPGPFGFEDGLGGLCVDLFTPVTPRTDNRRMWFRLRGQDGQLSNIVGSIVRFTDARWACNGGPIISESSVTSVNGVEQPAGAMNVIAGKNEPISLAFKGAAKTDNNFTAINWRIRNSRTGDIFVKRSNGWAPCADPCIADANFNATESTTTGGRKNFADGTPGVQQTLDIPSGIPSRGRWIIEAAPQGTSEDDAYFMELGSVLINDKSTNSPLISLSGTPPARPNTDSSYTITASVGDPADPANTLDTQGGKAQIIEWDLNNNQTDGAAGDGYEIRYESDSSTGLSASDLTVPFTTAGKTPGPYTIRARVTDNGSINSSDNARRTAVATSTFTINSPPVAVTEFVDIEADQDQPAQVEFRANDADGDPYTVTVSPAAGNAGSISGGGNVKDYTWPSTFTGSDEFPFYASDDHNGVGPTGTLTVRVRPNTTIDAAAPNGTNANAANGYLGATTETSAEFDFSSPQTPVVGYECRLLRDGDVVEDWEACSNASTGSMDYEDLEDGLHRFEVRAINDEDQRDGTPAFRTFRVDTTAPVTEVLEGPPTDAPTIQPRPTNDPTPTYRFSADDNSPQEYVTYECRVLFGPQAENWVPCGAPSDTEGSAPVQIAGDDSPFGLPDALEEGLYAFEVRATDEVGLTGPVMTETFRVDLTPPVTSIASGPDGLINTRDVTFQVTSTEANSTFYCELVGEDQGIVFAEALCPGGASPAFTGLADDVYTLTIGAQDQATNRDPNPQVAEFEIDATTPETTGGDVDFGNGVTPDRSTQSRRITVSFDGTDNRAMQGFQCRLDSADDEDWTTCQSPETYTGLADGQHSLEIRSIDEAQNLDPTPLLIEWDIDFVAPVTTIDASPSEFTNNDSPAVEFSTNEGATSECRLDEGTWVTCSSPADVSALNGGDPLADGPHTFTVRSKDVAGNQELTAASVTWTQDTVVPVVDLTSTPAEFVPQGDADFGWTVKDGDPLVMSPEAGSECQVDGGAWEDCDRSLTIEAPANGVHTFAVRATDQAGNVSDVVDYTFEVLGTPPSAPSIDNSDPADGSTVRANSARFAFSHPDENESSFDSFECRVDAEAWGTCESPYEVEGLSDGAHKFELRAKDVAGNLSPVSDIDWEVQSAAPITSIDTGPSGLTRQNSASITFSSNKAGTFECKMDSEAWAACETPLELTGISDGQHTFRVRAVSTAAPVGVKDPSPPSRTWTVDTTVPDTTIDSAPEPSPATTEDRSASIEFSSDDQSAGFQCKIDDEVFDACSSPWQLNDLPVGIHTVVVRAVDDAGNADETPATTAWTIVAAEVPTCPVGTEGTPPNCTPIQINGTKVTAKLKEGTLGLADLGDVPLPENQITLTGALDEEGNWGVPQGGVEFLPVEQQLYVEQIGGEVTIKISLFATGPGTGKLPTGGGAAAFNLPVQARIEVSLGSAVLIGPAADCALRPVTFDLTGQYDEAAKTVTVSSDSVSFPTVSAGCGGLGNTVNDQLDLPRDDIGVTMTFGLEKETKVEECPAGTTGTFPDCKTNTTPGPALLKTTVKGPKKIKSGKPATLIASVKNSGESAAANVSVCLTSPKKLVKGKAKRCGKKVASIAAGATAKVKFKVKTKPGKKGKRVRFKLSTSAPSLAGNKISHVTLLK